MSDVLLPVCRLSDIPMQGSRIIERRGDPAGNIAVFRGADDRVFAIRDRCPHRGGPLSQGIVFGAKVACPLHNWTIDLATGCAAAPDEGCVPTFEVRIVDGVVAVALPAGAA